MVDFMNTRAGTAGFLLILTIFLAMQGCETLTGDLKGDVTENQLPVVEFANVPADGDTFSFAPVIYWKGRDADGFVEYFTHADIIDSTALADPEYYIDFIPDEAWDTTEATADTVFLLTTAGQVTEHVFYLKAIDDRGDQSEVIHRRFSRSNQPPKVPDVKWSADSDKAFGHDIPIDSLDEEIEQALFDTLYVLDKNTDTWAGLGFTWRSSDPDDRDLYKIPLEFRYYLEKTPHDTVWQWVSNGWTSDQELKFYGLETGHYSFTVWARDDGFEMSERPASATFDVYRPSFEQSVLLVNTTRENENATEGLGNIVPGTQVGDLYRDLASRYPDMEYFHFPTHGSDLHKSYLGRFRLVIWFSENMLGGGGEFASPLRSYVRVGGRLWVMGSFLGRNVLTGNAITELAEAQMGSAVSVPVDTAEFVQANSGVNDLPDIDIDTSITAEVFEVFFESERRPYRVRPLLPGVDVLIAGQGAETAYYFQSYTDTANGDVFNDTARVITSIDTTYFPPTPTDCLIKISTKRVLEVSRVENITRGVTGEVLLITNNRGADRETVVRVSYEYGEPWKPTDIVTVDYRFQPFSDFHLKPCAIRYEKISRTADKRGYEVRYRVAIFAFPLYFMDNSNGAVSQMFNSMLNWFFQPYAH